LPKYTSRIVINQIKPLCNAYHELVNPFINYDMEKLNGTILKYQNIYQHDMNFGLIKQLEQTLVKNSIQKLTKTYMTLSLSDMAVKVKLRTDKEAEAYLVNMIKDGEIYAMIDQKEGMVMFNDYPEKYDSTEMIQYLNEKMSGMIDYDKKIIEMDREITTHPHYIQKFMNSSQGPVDDLFEQQIVANR
jgi:COP9 signalosome complex subunit 3